MQHQFGQRLLVEVGYMGNRGNQVGNQQRLGFASHPVPEHVAVPRYRHHQRAGRRTSRIRFTAFRNSPPPPWLVTTTTPFRNCCCLPGVHRGDIHGRLRLLLVSRAWHARGEALSGTVSAVQANYTWSKLMEADTRHERHPKPPGTHHLLVRPPADASASTGFTSCRLARAGTSCRAPRMGRSHRGRLAGGGDLHRARAARQ